MFYKLQNRLLPCREPDHANGWHYLNEDFAAWRGVVQVKETAGVSAEHEYFSGCECFHRLCGPGMGELANESLKEVKMDQRVLTVIALMKHDPGRALPLSRLAKSVNLSTNRLSCLFKAEIGTPPARYLRTLRMQDATTLLVNTFLSVKEIVARVGFTDESHFVKGFKRIYGVTPTDYRKQNGVIDVQNFVTTNGRKDRPRFSKKRQ